ncbi:MAG: serine--tRNA ligase, partial [Campylobacteraceae bacterium]
NLLNELNTRSLALKSPRQELENLQSEQNANSKLFGKIDKSEQEALKDKLLKNKEAIAKANDELKLLEDSLIELAYTTPNIPDAEVPFGEDENDNIELKKVLDIPKFSFTPKEHWEIDEEQNLLDFTRGVKLAKTRFSLLKGRAAKLERALINYMIEFNEERGFSLVSVPFLVNSNSLFGTGQLPKFKEDLFKLENEDLYLIPTSEVPVTNIYADEIISKDELPLKFTCHSACFRSEAGSAGRDTRGLMRQHQFHKVELVSITTPDNSDKMFEEMVSCASDLLTSLGLPHRHMLLCGGDLGFGASKTIDLEVWLPGQNKYREISSISNTRDFQARRAKIRFKDEKKNTLVHTLNGSSLAVGRTIIAIMENYQKEDGSFDIPEVLKPYM